MAKIFTPVAIGWLVDALGSARPDPDAAVRAFAAVLCLGILFQLLQKSGDYVWAGLEVGIMRRIGADAFARVQRYSSDWHADTFAGATVRNITRGIRARHAWRRPLLPSWAVRAITVGAVALMIWHWPLMGLVFLAGALYTAVSVRLSLGYVAPLRRLAVESDSRVGGALADALTCNAVVKSTAAEDREDVRLGGILDTWQANMLRSWYASIHTEVAQTRFSCCSTACWPAGPCGCGQSTGPVPATSPTYSPAS